MLEFVQLVHPDIKATTPWKVHVIVTHLPLFLKKYQTGMSIYAEQTVEALHADYKKTEKRFLVQEAHVEHGKKLKRSVVEYNSRRI